MHSVRAYKMIFAVLERRLIQLLIKWLQFLINNICCFINHFTNNLVIISLFVTEHCLFTFLQIKCVYGIGMRAAYSFKHPLFSDYVEFCGWVCMYACLFVCPHGFSKCFFSVSFCPIELIF